MRFIKVYVRTKSPAVSGVVSDRGDAAQGDEVKSAGWQGRYSRGVELRADSNAQSTI